MSLKRCGPLQRFEVQQELTQQIRQPPLPVTLQAYQRPRVSHMLPPCWARSHLHDLAFIQ